MCRSKIKVLVHSNYSRLVTGFGKNMRNILLGLYSDPDIEVIEAANGVQYGVDLMTPWKSFGTYPNDKLILKQIENDQSKKRSAQYGFYCIDKIIDEVKPDIYLGIEDIWAFSNFEKRNWWPKTKTILWTTLDSLPILDQAVIMEPKCDKMLVWASFAEHAMHQLGHTNVETIHGAIDYNNFKPLKNRKILRQRQNLDNNFVIGFVFKNQLRKSVPNILEGFKLFKSKNPDANAKLLLHTDWSETTHGWDIKKYIKEKNIDSNDVLATYVCHKCDEYFLRPYTGEEKSCELCGCEKCVKTKNSGKGVREKQLNEIYNIMDVYCHPFTSGGQELPIQEAKAAGLITLVTDYSCGTDSAYPEQGGLPLKWNEYREPHTQFIKATTCPQSICDQIEFVYNIDPEYKQVLLENGRQTILNKFCVDNTIRKLKEIILSVNSIDKNKSCEEEGKIEKKNTANLEKLIDDIEFENRIAVVIPNSELDVLIVNSLIENLHNLYEDKKIFVFTKEENFIYLEDNPFVYRMLRFTDQMENPLLLEGSNSHTGYFKLAFFPYVSTQKILSSIHNGADKHQFELT